MVRPTLGSMKDAFRLDGKNAIITGGNRGIGLGIGTAFAQSGANVAIMCRNQESGKAAAADLAEKYGVKTACYSLDITDMKSCKAAVEAYMADFGSVDILVNNAGIAVAGPVLDMDEEMTDWFKCIDADLSGAMRMCYLVGPIMRDSGKGGKVINITSNSGLIINKPMTFAPYHAAKAGLNHLTRDLAVEWGQYGINVNAIAPGYTMSPMMDKMPEDARVETIAKIPTGRFNETIEIGALAVFLASEASNIITGSVILADGGYSLAV